MALDENNDTTGVDIPDDVVPPRQLDLTTFAIPNLGSNRRDAAEQQVSLTPGTDAPQGQETQIVLNASPQTPSAIATLGVR